MFGWTLCIHWVLGSSGLATTISAANDPWGFNFALVLLLFCFPSLTATQFPFVGAWPFGPAWMDRVIMQFCEATLPVKGSTG